MLNTSSNAAETITPTPYQQRVLLVPETVTTVLEGGSRGCGKSFGSILLILRHVQAHGRRARIWYVRKTYKGLSDVEATLLDIIPGVFPGARYNASEHVWRFPSGAILELAQLDCAAAYRKFQGRSATMIVASEAQQWASPDLLLRLRSNLRGPPGISLRCILEANCGDIGHHWLARLALAERPWVPFDDPKMGRTVYCPGSYRNNPHLDTEQYRKSLILSCSGDAGMLAAWEDGQWGAIAAGSFFHGSLSEKRSAVVPFPHARPAPLLDSALACDPVWRGAQYPNGWRFALSYDHGCDAPPR